MTGKRVLKRSLPGDHPVDADVVSMIRVDHAGEYGAKRIYEGQLAVLGQDPKMKKLLEHMAAQEQVHLDYFEKEIVKRKMRPTALHPLWHAAGYALGALTARMGREAAMACTVAVEEVISEHYKSQLEALAANRDEKALEQAIRKFKAEEEDHRAIGLDHQAEQAPAYPVLSAVIKAGSRLAIKIAKKI